MKHTGNETHAHMQLSSITVCPPKPPKLYSTHSVIFFHAVKLSGRSDRFGPNESFLAEDACAPCSRKLRCRLVFALAAFKSWATKTTFPQIIRLRSRKGMSQCRGVAKLRRAARCRKAGEWCRKGFTWAKPHSLSYKCCGSCFLLGRLWGLGRHHREKLRRPFF